MLKEIARSLVKRVCRLFSEQQVIGLLTTACQASDAWVRAGTRVPHLEECLQASRLDKSDVDKVVRRAAKKHPHHRLFLLSDLPELRRIGVESGTWIEDLAAVRKHSGDKVVALLLNDDETIPAVLREIDEIDRCVYITSGRGLPPARYFHRNRAAQAALLASARTSSQRSHFDLVDFENIMQALEITRNIIGDYVEIGVYRGGSAYAALAYMREADLLRRSYFFDTFQGFNYQTAVRSKDADWAGTHEGTSLERVRAALAEFDNAHVERLEITNEDLPAEIERIAVANVDVDMYEAVLESLRKIAPRLAPGGILIAEDQGHTPGLAGAFRAVQEFLASEEGRRFMPVHLSSGQMLMIKLHSGSALAGYEA